MIKIKFLKLSCPTWAKNKHFWLTGLGIGMSGAGAILKVVAPAAGPLALAIAGVSVVMNLAGNALISRENK